MMGVWSYLWNPVIAMSVEHGWEQKTIALKELLSTVLAVAIWGQKWAEVMLWQGVKT